MHQDDMEMGVWWENNTQTVVVTTMMSQHTVTQQSNVKYVTLSSTINQDIDCVTP